MHYFLDAAGDPGFKKQSKPFYVQCLIAIPNATSKAKIQDKMSELKKLFKMNSDSEFKYNSFDQRKRIAFFTEIAKMDLKAYTAVVDKNLGGIVAHRFAKMDGNSITGEILVDLIADVSVGITEYSFTIDGQKSDKKLTDKWRVDASRELKTRGIICNCVRFTSQVSHRESCLQIADMIAGVVMDRFETNNYGLLKPIEPILNIKIL